MTVVTWRYRLEPSKEHNDSWSIVFVDSTGCFTVLSDYGNYGARWWTPHTGCKDFREFLVDCDSDYIANKIGRHEDNHKFDSDLTRESICRRIIELRREGYFSKEEARDEYEMATGIDDHIDFHYWYMKTKVRDDAYDLARYTRTGWLTHWTTVSFERLKGVIRAELAAERQAS